jgi:hypothetical protein
VRLNEKLARHLDLDPAQLASLQGVEVLAGNRVPDAGEPLALAYVRRTDTEVGVRFTSGPRHVTPKRSQIVNALTLVRGDQRERSASIRMRT